MVFLSFVLFSAWRKEKKNNIYWFGLIHKIEIETVVQLYLYCLLVLSDSEGEPQSIVCVNLIGINTLVDKRETLFFCWVLIKRDTLEHSEVRFSIFGSFESVGAVNQLK